MRPTKAQQRERERLMAKWLGLPVGTPVTVTRDNGEKLATVTRSEPWWICGTPVILVDGIPGGYSLDRLALAAAPPSGER